VDAITAAHAGLAVFTGSGGGWGAGEGSCLIGLFFFYGGDEDFEVLR